MNVFKMPDDTVEQRIKLFYADDYKLSADDLKIKERIDTAHSLRHQEYSTDSLVVSTLVKRYGITSRQAYFDIAMSKRIFGHISKTDKDELRHLVTEWSIELFKMSHKSKNLKGMEKAVERITKANNLDKEDMDLPDASKIQPPVQLLSVNFNFINSPMFKKVDQAMQVALLNLYDEFMLQVKLTPLAEYTDLWEIDDSVRPNQP
jgi:hypothetical protein